MKFCPAKNSAKVQIGAILTLNAASPVAAAVVVCSCEL